MSRSQSQQHIIWVSFDFGKRISLRNLTITNIIYAVSKVLWTDNGLTFSARTCLEDLEAILAQFSNNQIEQEFTSSHTFMVDNLFAEHREKYLQYRIFFTSN